MDLAGDRIAERRLEDKQHGGVGHFLPPAGGRPTQRQDRRSGWEGHLEDRREPSAPGTGASDLERHLEPL